VVDTSQALSKSDAYAVIVGLVEKIADIKLKTQSQEILLLICEHVGLHFVFSLVYSLAKKHRNPKVSYLRYSKRCGFCRSCQKD